MLSTTIQNMSLRKINTYVIRDGRITQGQLKALENYYQKNTIPIDELNPLKIYERFGNDNPIILEIGFGSGEHLIANAIKSPDINFIGLEVFRSGIGQVLNAIEEHKLHNIKVINHDAVELLNHHIPERLFTCIQILFPDPWPKKRHHKRRMINPEFMNLISTKVLGGGYLFLATDEKTYAEQIDDVLNNQNYFSRVLLDDDNAAYFYRSSTRFERRGIKLGNAITEWRLQKI